MKPRVQFRPTPFGHGVHREGWLDLVALAALLSLGLALSDSVNFIPLLDAPRWWQHLLHRWVEALATVVPLLLIMAVGDRLLSGAGAWRWASLVGLVAVAGAAGATGNFAATSAMGSTSDRIGWVDWPFSLAGALVLATLIASVLEFQRLSDAASAALDGERLRAVSLLNQLAEARLQMLQAQIEPHFLFNSLANVRRLSRVDPSAGAAMLSDLLRYLESALPRLRDATPTLEREIELARSFLAIHQVRMGNRLAVRFDVEPGLAGAAVPPMMLLTLVENALKHGIGPLPEGGSILIEAHRDNNAIRLRVSDSGRGMGAAQGRGVGLANVRSRLRSLYGSAAQLSLHLNEPHGVIATIVLPERRT